MLSVKEAKEVVGSAIRSLPPRTIPLVDACNLVLAENVYAAADLPVFDQSNVDGYAVQINEAGSPLPVVGEVAAGASIKWELQVGTAMRIFTGAPVPASADAIVMQEKVSGSGDSIMVNDQALVRGMNIRQRGTDIKKGELAIEAGNQLTPAAIGYLASAGVAAVAIYPAPSVAVIVTGKELVPPGTALHFGQIFESGSFILRTALQQDGVTSIRMSYCNDALDEITRALQWALQENDLVLLTGGVSVGDYDFVSRAAENCGVTRLFHGVKQKPGKPLYFGKKEEKFIFGLPGNPSSVLTCFYEYVAIALNVYLHLPHDKYILARLRSSYKKPAGLTHFLKGIYDSGEVTILSAQESYRMSSFARSNCLVVLPEQQTDFDAGHQTEVHLL